LARVLKREINKKMRELMKTIYHPKESPYIAVCTREGERGEGRGEKGEGRGERGEGRGERGEEGRG
jgi:hypothetical protein